MEGREREGGRERGGEGTEATEFLVSFGYPEAARWTSCFLHRIAARMSAAFPELASHEAALPGAPCDRRACGRPQQCSGPFPSATPFRGLSSPSERYVLCRLPACVQVYLSPYCSPLSPSSPSPFHPSLPGRSGRAGASGRAISFYTSEDERQLRAIARVAAASGLEDGRQAAQLEWMKQLPRRRERRRERGAGKGRAEPLPPKRLPIASVPGAKGWNKKKNRAGKD